MGGDTGKDVAVRIEPRLQFFVLYKVIPNAIRSISLHYRSEPHPFIITPEGPVGEDLSLLEHLPITNPNDPYRPAMCATDAARKVCPQCH